MLQRVNDRGQFGIEILNRLLYDSVPYLTCQLDDQGAGATAAAAIRGMGANKDTKAKKKGQSSVLKWPFGCRRG